jgi:hypothetical protein
VFSPFFLHCFCSFSVSPPFSFLFFCSFFLWVLLFFPVPLLSIVSSCFRPFSFSVFALFLSAHPLTFCFYVRCFLWVLLFFFYPSSLSTVSCVFALFPPLLLFFFCQPTLFFFVFGSFSSFYSQRMSCVFLDNEDIQDRYYRSNGNGWRWQGYLLFFD